MSRVPRDALRARTTFVVGKGGVGKSTTAVAIAFDLAEAAQPTWLISVDPAHSLQDILGGRQIPHLQVEEFDAAAYADVWLGRTRAALLDVVERGTYLDAADAAAFLDQSFPGLDEVMAAFRLVELQHTNAARIVVDTAPTGHTLRLLEAGDLIDSWADALEAMAAKADAVASAFAGRAVAAPGAVLAADWRAQAEQFRQLLRGADFVVVTRAGAVVASETARLTDELRRRGLHVAGTLGIGHDVHGADWQIPLPRLTPSARSRPSHTAVADWIKGLPVSFFLCAGKGGVGKSTCAAAVALTRAETGAACLVSTDPAGSLQDVLDIPITAEPTEPTRGLRTWQLDAKTQLERLRAEYTDEVGEIFARLGLDQSLGLDRRVIEKLWNLAPPGIDEIVALTELLRAAERCPVTVLDSAPTGHFLRLVAMPEIAVNWSHALLRTLIKYKAAGALERFTRATVDFARQARSLTQLLVEPTRTATLLVTLAEPVVWAETARLHASLTAAQIPVAAVVINRSTDGDFREPPEFVRRTRVIRAPLLSAPPTGVETLREFLSQWEFTA